MTPSDAVAMLDRRLAQDGQDILLRRPGAPSVEVTVRAFVVPQGVENLDGNVDQQRFSLILSPTQIIAAGWPGALAQTDGSDARVPRRGDKVKVNGVWREVMSALPKSPGGALVRIDMVAEG